MVRMFKKESPKYIESGEEEQFVETCGEMVFPVADDHPALEAVQNHGRDGHEDPDGLADLDGQGAVGDGGGGIGHCLDNVENEL